MRIRGCGFGVAVGVFSAALMAQTTSPTMASGPFVAPLSIASVAPHLAYLGDLVGSPEGDVRYRQPPTTTAPARGTVSNRTVSADVREGIVAIEVSRFLVDTLIATDFADWDQDARAAK